MLGVTETILTSNTAEPGPLAVVRDRDGDLWIHAGGDDTEPWTQVTGDCAGTSATWDDLHHLMPLYAVERTSETYAPWAPPAGPQVDEELRTAHLAALDAQRRAFDAQAWAWPQVVATIAQASAAALQPAPSAGDITGTTPLAEDMAPQPDPHEILDDTRERR